MPFYQGLVVMHKRCMVCTEKSSALVDDLISQWCRSEVNGSASQ